MNLKIRVDKLEAKARVNRAIDMLADLIKAVDENETNLHLSKELEYFVAQAKEVLDGSNWYVNKARAAARDLTESFPDMPREEILKDVARSYKVSESVLM